MGKDVAPVPRVNHHSCVADVTDPDRTVKGRSNPTAKKPVGQGNLAKQIKDWDRAVREDFKNKLVHKLNADIWFDLTTRMSSYGKLFPSKPIEKKEQWTDEICAANSALNRAGADMKKSFNDNHEIKDLIEKQEIKDLIEDQVKEMKVSIFDIVTGQIDPAKSPSKE